ncbi:MAG TPA: hypothetical protein PLD25_05260 [Chloroflexota bacterium]|nr:hypothetical protein [Chloroflexota bacterium]HUM71868.1 hypothetical protein [Chloroflexota bacterium]
MTTSQHSSPPIFTLFFGLMFIAAGFCATAIFSQTSDLHCTRLEPSFVRCTRQNKLFGLYAMSETEFNNISGAVVRESCDEEGCAYRVELKTETGTMPLNVVYRGGIGGQNSQQDRANQINDFLADDTAVAIAITETTGEKAMTFLPLLFVLFGIAMLVKGTRDFMTNYEWL